MDLNKIPELRKELEFITAHRDQWYQGTWWSESSENSCGTVGCLAGNAVNNSSEFTIEMSPYNVPYPKEITTGREWDWTRAGAEILGLTLDEAVDMFRAANSLYHLWALANKFSKGEIEIPNDVVKPDWYED